MAPSAAAATRAGAADGAATPAVGGSVSVAVPIAAVAGGSASIAVPGSVVGERSTVAVNRTCQP
jgi:hypothetical protein